MYHLIYGQKSRYTASLMGSLNTKFVTIYVYPTIYLPNENFEDIPRLLMH